MTSAAAMYSTMVTSDSPADSVRRREGPRLMLAAEGLFIGLEKRQKVTVLDLSQSGARIAFAEPPDDKAGFIRWMEFETFGDVVWQKGLFVGLQFDRPLPDAWLEETAERAAHVQEEEHDALRREAEEWING